METSWSELSVANDLPLHVMYTFSYNFFGRIVDKNLFLSSFWVLMMWARMGVEMWWSNLFYLRTRIFIYKILWSVYLRVIKHFLQMLELSIPYILRKCEFGLLLASIVLSMLLEALFSILSITFLKLQCWVTFWK